MVMMDSRACRRAARETTEDIVFKVLGEPSPARFAYFGQEVAYDGKGL